MKTLFRPRCLAALLLVVSAARAEVSLPAIFSDHMVLQRDVPIPVWGRAEAGEEVSVTIAGQTKTTKAGADGKWRVKLDKISAAEPVSCTVRGKNEIVISDVLAGEVWLCSGQSNMGFVVRDAENFEQEKAAAEHPKLRMFIVTSGAATEPQEKCNGKWIVCGPETVGGFSATAYFFGRDLQAKLGAPVGLIHSSVGGTPIEAWTSLAAQKDVPEVQPIFESWEKRIATWDPAKVQADFETKNAAYPALAEKAKADGKPAPRKPTMPVEPAIDSHRPANLFNGKIAPLIPYAIKGAIWYQGEANSGSPAAGLAYRKQLPLLISDWRARWGQGDFPFAWVQLPDFVNGSSDGWCLVREAMLQSLRLPHTGMAVTLGLGEKHNVHPVKKQEVGRRLSLWALGTVYGGKGETSGPLYAGHKIDGSDVTITFTHADGLTAAGGELKGFVIAGDDHEWKPALTKIDGDKIIVSTPDGANAAAVRYAWASDPEWSLTNAAGLPASPFRTDDWPLATAP